MLVLGRFSILALLAFTFAFTAAAEARVGPASPIAGPSAAVIELGDVAMAADGTGGVVYRAFEAGAPHIYAARYDGTEWHQPQRLDVGQRFESAWPRIGAANGGMLVVTWTQDGPPSQDSLYSALLPRGGTQFLAPTLVDWTVGEARSTFPSLAMAPNGAALIAYRVVSIDAFSRFTMPGYVESELRLARFNGSRWTRLGQPLNRNRLTPQRTPTAANSPKVAIAPNGDGVVAWQEPDDQLVDRIWARRIFGTRLGIPLQASPVSADGKAVGGNADAVAVAATEEARALVILRQASGPGEQPAGPRIYLNELRREVDKTAKEFAGPEFVGAGGAAGSPLVAAGEPESLLLAFARGSNTVLASGEDGDRIEKTVLTGGSEAVQPDIDAAVGGRGTVAFADGDRVVVQQLAGADPTSTQALSGPGGGPIRTIAVAGSGTGDALVAFAQGEPERGQIMVARVDAAPLPFRFDMTPKWSNALRPKLVWEAAPRGFQPRSYTIVLDGRNVARVPGTRTSFSFPEGTVDDGVHNVLVLATGRGGDSTLSNRWKLRIDRTPPRVTVRVGRAHAAVVVADGPRRRASGPAASKVRWGDGGRGSIGRSGRGRHRYRRPGTYLVRVKARDRAGNEAVAVQRLRIG